MTRKLAIRLSLLSSILYIALTVIYFAYTISKKSPTTIKVTISK